MIRIATIGCLLAATGGACASGVSAATQTDGEPVVPGPDASIETKVADLRERAIVVESILPDDDDFSDLEPLIELIGDKRVVALGEANHGDGASLAAKSRVFRFLHQKMGFDVILWESGSYDCWKMDLALEEGLDWRDSADIGMSAVWSGNPWSGATFSYAWESYLGDLPVRMGGFDPTIIGQRTWRLWAEDFVNFMLATTDLGEDALIPDEDIERSLTIIERLESPELFVDHDEMVRIWEELLHYDSLIDEHEASLIEATSERELEEWRRFLGDMITYSRMRAQGPWEDLTNLDFYNERDDRMGENLRVLIDETFADRKIVVWAATFHLMRDVSALRTLEQSDELSLVEVAGEQMAQSAGDDLYTIAFVSGHGQTGRIGNPAIDVGPTQDGSFEDVAGRVGAPFLYVDIASVPETHWLSGTFVSKALGWLWFDNERAEMAPNAEHAMLSVVEAEWDEQLDAFFYIDAPVSPATRDRGLHDPEADLPIGARLMTDQRRESRSGASASR